MFHFYLNKFEIAVSYLFPIIFSTNRLTNRLTLVMVNFVLVRTLE